MRNVRYSRFRPKADLKLSRKRTPTRVQCILQWIYVPALVRVSACEFLPERIMTAGRNSNGLRVTGRYVDLRYFGGPH